MSSRESILGKLRAARQPFTDWPPVADRLPVALVEDQTPEGLRARFIREAEALLCTVSVFTDAAEARRHVLDLIGEDRAIQCWDPALIPLEGLAAALDTAGIHAAPGDATVRVGLTGVDAALAATGTLLLISGPGKPRQASLVPPVHIAVVTTDQIAPNFEGWLAAQRATGVDRLQAASNITLISGPSRTGDIAYQLVMGVHGPGTVHVVLLA